MAASMRGGWGGGAESRLEHWGLLRGHWCSFPGARAAFMWDAQ